MHAYWRAANYLSVGQIYLLDNPLLREPLKLEHTKPRLLGHWGTTPGLNFIYVHLNRIIKARDLDMIYIAGPGHGGPGLVANTYLEGTYSEVYPEHLAGRPEGCRSSSSSSRFPAAFPVTSRRRRPDRFTKAASWATRSCTPTARPSTIPDLARRVRRRRRRSGDRAARGELALEQVPQSRPRRRGAADPASQRLQDRQPHRARAHQPRRAARSLRGYGYKPYFVEGDDPAEAMHQLMAATLDAGLRRDPRDSRTTRDERIHRRGRAGR